MVKLIFLLCRETCFFFFYFLASSPSSSSQTMSYFSWNRTLFLTKHLLHAHCITLLFVFMRNSSEMWRERNKSVYWCKGHPQIYLWINLQNLTPHWNRMKECLHRLLMSVFVLSLNNVQPQTLTKEVFYIQDLMAL